MDEICVRINIEALCLRLSHERGRALGKREVHAWLNGSGLRLTGDSWACDTEDALRHLEPAELIRMTRIAKDGAVTFVEHQEPPK